MANAWISIFLLISPVFAAVAPRYIQKIDDQKEVMSVNDNFREAADFANKTKVDLDNFGAQGSTFSVHQVFDSLTTTSLIFADGTTQTTAATATDTDALIKAWCNFDGTLTDPITCRDEFNVVNVNDNGTGDYTVNWDTDFADTNYAVFCDGYFDLGVAMRQCFESDVNKAVGSVDIVSVNSAFTANDSFLTKVLAVGDQ